MQRYELFLNAQEFGELFIFCIIFAEKIRIEILFSNQVV